MPTDITLPPLDGTPPAIRIEHYYAQSGDAVAAGQPLLIVADDRFEWDVPASASGTIIEIVAQQGTTVAIGAALVRVQSTQDESDTDVAANGRAMYATPSARRIAATHGLDLVAVTGSGRGGRIMRADVLSLVADQLTTEAEPAFNSCFSLDLPTQATITAPSGEQQPTDADRSNGRESVLSPVIAPSGLIVAPSDVPQALTAVEVELSDVMTYVDTHHARLMRRGIGLTVTACVAYAVATALAEHRWLNSAWTDDGVILRARTHLDVRQNERQTQQHTLIVDAADLNVRGMARMLSGSSEGDVARLNPGSQPRATFTIIAGGTRWNEILIGADQAAALSIGAVEQRPVVVERGGIDTVAIRPVAILMLAYDSRIIDQQQADAFMVAIKRRLEHFRPL